MKTSIIAEKHFEESLINIMKKVKKSESNFAISDVWKNFSAIKSSN